MAIPNFSPISKCFPVTNTAHPLALLRALRPRDKPLGILNSRVTPEQDIAGAKRWQTADFGQLSGFLAIIKLFEPTSH
jgi:hypothetical protein